MNEMWPSLVFYTLAGVTLASASFTAFTRHVVHSAFSLLLTFLGLAGLYISLGADFVGLAQVMVYVGGILVLLLFGVMLTQRDPSGAWEQTRSMASGLVMTGLLLIALLIAIFATPWPMVETLPAAEPTMARLAHKLMNTYLLSFEAAAILLLAAMIGAAMIARGEPKQS